MLLLTPASSAPNRIQGSWVSEEEVRAVVAAWRRQNNQTGDSATEHEVLDGPVGAGGEQLAIDLRDDVVADVGGDDEDGDDLLMQAMEEAGNTGQPVKVRAVLERYGLADLA